MSQMRADQVLSRFGYCSRREAPYWLKSGRLEWRGLPIRSGAEKVNPAEVEIDGEKIEFPGRLLIAFHKPVGCVCSHESAEGETVYDLLPDLWRHRHPAPVTVGRLDKETSGLILVTDDGALAHRWTSPRHEVEKVYLAETENDLRPAMVQTFASGELVLRNESEPCRPAKLDILHERQARVTVTEGRYHQVRRMFASQGCAVVSLHRERIGKLELGDLPTGAWRPVHEEDI